MKIPELADGSQLYETDRGPMRVTRLGSGCTSHVCVGHLTVDLAPVVMADGDELLAAFDRVAFFVDCYDLRHLDPAFREHMMVWFKTHRRRRIAAHMLVRSKVIELAANVANMLSDTRFAQVYSSIAQWQTACQRDFAGFRRQPLEGRPPRVNAAS